MERMLTFFTFVLALTASGQTVLPPSYPYNPDSDGDEFVAVSDVLMSVASYDNEFQAQPIMVDTLSLEEAIQILLQQQILNQQTLIQSQQDLIEGLTNSLEGVEGFEPCLLNWTCGCAMEYHGYEYETILIGEQCWFSENLKTEHYRTGDFIPSSTPDSALWTSQGAQTVLYLDTTYIADRGRLYNVFAVIDNRGLCPQGWHVPSDDDFLSLESFIGIPEDQLFLLEPFDGRGLDGDFAAQLKSQTGWFGTGAGSDDYGLDLTPTGYQFYADGEDGFGNQNEGAYWSSSPLEGGDRFIYRGFSSANNGILRWHDDPAVGFGVRCILDSE
jgi:uncharacterized protein (TIGR02145 family)